MGNSTGNADKKSTKIDQNGKTTREKITVQLEEINQEVLEKEGRLKSLRLQLTLM